MYRRHKTPKRNECSCLVPAQDFQQNEEEEERDNRLLGERVEVFKESPDQLEKYSRADIEAELSVLEEEIERTRSRLNLLTQNSLTNPKDKNQVVPIEYKATSTNNEPAFVNHPLNSDSSEICTRFAEQVQEICSVSHQPDFVQEDTLPSNSLEMSEFQASINALSDNPVEQQQYQTEFSENAEISHLYDSNTLEKLLVALTTALLFQILTFFV